MKNGSITPSALQSGAKIFSMLLLTTTEHTTCKVKNTSCKEQIFKHLDATLARSGDVFAMELSLANHIILPIRKMTIAVIVMGIVLAIVSLRASSVCFATPPFMIPLSLMYPGHVRFAQNPKAKTNTKTNMITASTARGGVFRNAENFSQISDVRNVVGRPIGNGTKFKYWSVIRSMFM